jgi:hypothetical protein
LIPRSIHDWNRAAFGFFFDTAIGANKKFVDTILPVNGAWLKP